MEDLGIVEDGAVAVSNGKIMAAGKSNEVLGDYNAAERIDATGRVVMPGFVDAHTHLVFAGSRERELELKIKGAGYMKILQEGGGILSTVRRHTQSNQRRPTSYLQGTLQQPNAPWNDNDRSKKRLRPDPR